MVERKQRVLLVATHPTQYGAPIYRLLARDLRVEIQVAFCSLQGAKQEYDSEFGCDVQWDVPLLDGYAWVEVPNRSPLPKMGWFWRYLNPGLWKLIRRGRFDVVILFTSYRCATFWIGLLAAKASRTAVVFGTDAATLDSRDGRRWKRAIKERLWPRLFCLADLVIVSSFEGITLMRSLGIRDSQLVLTPNVVDNERWSKAAARVNRAAVRAQWGIPADAPVVVFSAKLQSWKRPLDVLQAFARAGLPGSYLIFAGEGPLKGQLEKEIARLGLQGRVRLMGFINQSQLPEVYRAADVLVLPSDHEPFGVVVNEAMLCGCIPIVSDKVGGRVDLIEAGKTGFVFPVGDVERLSVLLAGLLGDPARLHQMSKAAREKIAGWSPELNVNRLVQAIAMGRAVAARNRSERNVLEGGRRAPSSGP